MRPPDTTSAPASLEHPASERFAAFPEGRTFLNAAYMSPKPLAALQALRRVTERMAHPDFAPDEFFEPLERIRERLARLVGGRPQSFSLTESVSYGTATIAWNLRVRADAIVGGRRHILGVDGQFPSNVQTWSHLERHGFRFTLVDGGPGATQRILDALDDDTALVALEPLSWTTGARLDLARLVPRIREAGARVLLDVTQSAGVDSPLPDALDVDVVLGAGYKWLLGPYGTGFLRLTPELQEKLEPLEWNWKNFAGSHDFNRLTEYATEFAGPAAKFDHGESSAFLRSAAWHASLSELEEIGLDSLREHAHAFASAVRGMLDPDRYRVSDVDSPEQAPHLFRIEPVDPALFDPVSEALDRAGVSVSRRAGGWRVSPHVYNDARCARRLAGALASTDRAG